MSVPKKYFQVISRIFYVLLIVVGLSVFGSTRAFAQSDISTPTPIIPTPTMQPAGQLIKLDFGIPGIGTQSSNLKPLTPARDVTLFFFASDSNSSDPNVKPIGVFKTQVTYDTDPASPTYGNFSNPQIDLGDGIPDGVYQIVFKTKYALPYLIKTKPTDIGGKAFDVRKINGLVINISVTDIITGDIYPSPGGDNEMDINDYNAFVGCYGAKADTKSCPDKSGADINDDGLIDGTDYNIMLSNFKTLLSQGYPVPSLTDTNKTPSVKPTPKPTVKQIAAKPTVTPKKTVKAATKTKTLGAAGIFIPIAMLAFMVILGYFLIRRLKSRNKATPDQTMNSKAEKSVKENPADEQVDREFYVKKQTVDEKDGTIVLTLTDDAGPTLGYYKGADVKEGFAKVKGVMKKEGNKIFIDVSEITPEEETPAA